MLLCVFQRRAIPVVYRSSCGPCFCGGELRLFGPLTSSTPRQPFPCPISDLRHPSPPASQPIRPPHSTAEQGGNGTAKPGVDGSSSRDSVTWLRLDDLKENPMGRGFVERLDGVLEAHQVFRYIYVCVCVVLLLYVSYRWSTSSGPQRFCLLKKWRRTFGARRSTVAPVLLPRRRYHLLVLWGHHWERSQRRLLRWRSDFLFVWLSHVWFCAVSGGLSTTAFRVMIFFLAYLVSFTTCWHVSRSCTVVDDSVSPWRIAGVSMSQASYVDYWRHSKVPYHPRVSARLSYAAGAPFPFPPPFAAPRSEDLGLHSYMLFYEVRSTN